jgi:hypothetical protein
LERPQMCSTAMGCDEGTDAAVRLLLPHRWRRLLPHGGHSWFSPTAATAPPCNRWPRLLLPRAPLDCGATHVSVYRSVRGGGPLSGGGGGAYLHGDAALPAVAYGKPGGGSGISMRGSRFLPISAVRCCCWLLERPQSSIGSGCWRGPN